MFTGIVEETGIIDSVKKLQDGALITVKCSRVLEGTKADDSIAINGACQTVTAINNSTFTVFASYETLELTTLGSLKSGSKVNLERALRLCDRLGGHMVSGHIDGKGEFFSCEAIGDAYKMTFSVNEQLAAYIVKKGSVAIDGISLTVADIKDGLFNAAVIPHTYKNTLLNDLKAGSAVNIETDIIGKYVEKFLLSTDNNTVKNKISTDFLERNGFI